MTIFSKSLLGAGLALVLAAQPSLAAPAAAPAAPAAPAAADAGTLPGTVVPGLGVANLDAAVQMSNAFQVSAQQRQQTYKAALDSAQAKGNALQAQLKPLIDKYNADRAGGKVTAAVLGQQENAIRQIQARGQQDIQQTLYPVALSERYGVEQIEDKLDAAVRQAMAKRQITILLQPQAILARSNAYELTPAIVTELNTLIPNAQIVPPAGWEPREIREQKAQQAAQQGAKPAAAPAARPAAGPQPDSR